MKKMFLFLMMIALVYVLISPAHAAQPPADAPVAATEEAHGVYSRHDVPAPPNSDRSYSPAR